MGFVEDMFDTAKSVADAAVQKTEDLVGVSKLKLKISQTQKELSSVKEKLGGAVYNMRKNGFENEDLIVSLCGEIDDINNKLSDLNEQLSEVSRSKICPACTSKNKKEAIYCSYCGVDMFKAAQEKQAEAQTKETDGPEQI